MREKICVLASGGLESSVLLAELARQGYTVYPLYVSHGFVWEKAELYSLQRFLKKVSIPRVKALTVIRFPIRSLYGSHWSFTGKEVPTAKSQDRAVYLPGRNLLLLSIASVFAAKKRIPKIALGILKTNPFQDSFPPFLQKFVKACSRGLGTSLTVSTPFRKLNKPQVIALGRELPLGLTFSCLKPRRKLHCGVCNKCAERRRAFHKAFHKVPGTLRSYSLRSNILSSDSRLNELRQCVGRRCRSQPTSMS